MSIESMFDDLEGRFAHLQDQEQRALAEELTRAERAQLVLADRLRGAAGARITVRLGSGLAPTGRLARVGADWIELAESAEEPPRVLISMRGIEMLEGLEARARPAEESVLPAPTLRRELRSLARDRALVQLRTTSLQVRGRIAAVGLDALDLLVFSTGERGAVPPGARVTIPLAAIVLVAVDA